MGDIYKENPDLKECDILTRRSIEQFIIPDLKELSQNERDDIRNKILFCDNVGDMRKVIKGIGEKFNINYNIDEILKESSVKKNTNELSPEEYQKILKDIYSRINNILRYYCDLKEEYYDIITLWIIGTYFHDDFTTYPYLFFNAMRGSGKTRILNLISKLSKNGKLVTNISEAVLFRTAALSTICIDEFEGIGNKDNSSLRELLNTAYKKGMFVERVKKTSKNGEEKYEIERFNTYCPIVMANIWGMENVLSDRCITLLLEKSQDKRITMLIEDFDINPEIRACFDLFSVVCVVSLCKKTLYRHYITQWNAMVRNNDTNNTNNIYIHNNTNDTTKDLLFFDKIKDTTIDSRHLELFLPLFILANEIDENLVPKIVKTAEIIVKEKKEDDIIENMDVSLIDFISKIDETNVFISLKDLLGEFKLFLQEEEEEVKWVNSKWLGRALKRLGLIIEKKRLGKGREVRLDFKKAKRKILMFKDVPKEEN